MRKINFALVFIAMCVAGCGGGGGSTTPITPTAATPTFSPAAGSFTAAQSVTLSDGTTGASIYYTTDGTPPTTSSSLYSKAIPVSVTTTIEAIAVATGYTNSTVASGTFTISLPAAAAPTFSPAGGTFSAAQSVTLADATSGASIYYTTDGSTPTTSSTAYSKAIAVSATTTIKAIAAVSGYSNSSVASATYTISLPADAPVITTTPAQNGAVLVTLASTTTGATIYYTIDGSVPTTSSLLYASPFLVGSNLTVNAIAVAPGTSNSSVASEVFDADIPSDTLIWSDEFTNTGSSNAEPDPTVWTYDTGAGGWGNSELEDYCAWNSSASPCASSNPNVYVGTDGYLHIVLEQPSAGNYTSARMKSEGLFAFQYGRIEAKMQVPEGSGLWPAFWLLGANINTVPWPGCGELDIMEHIDGANPPLNGVPAAYDWTQSSIHGTNLNGGTPYTAAGFTATAWHTYGMIWTKGQIQFYVDDPTNVYETFNASTAGGAWPFDSGPQFIIMNLAMGGSWPGNPDGTAVLPAQLKVDYVRIYSN